MKCQISDLETDIPDQTLVLVDWRWLSEGQAWWPQRNNADDTSQTGQWSSHVEARMQQAILRPILRLRLVQAFHSTIPSGGLQS